MHPTRIFLVAADSFTTGTGIPGRPSMITRLAHVYRVVDDYDEALEWFTEKMGFEKRRDSPMGPDYRFLSVAPPGAETEIVLHLPMEGDDSEPGEGEMWVLAVDDCAKTCKELKQRGVEVTEPEEVPWGIHAFATDLYGNQYNLVQETQT